jgi:hypothetical protein
MRSDSAPSPSRVRAVSSLFPNSAVALVQHGLPETTSILRFVTCLDGSFFGSMLRPVF